MTRQRLTTCVITTALVVTGVSEGLAQPLGADVLKRGRARPDGTANVGVYVRTRAAYRAHWERFGYRNDRPAVNFDRRRVVFAATTERSSCPLRFKRVELRREGRKLIVHLSDGVSDNEACTDDVAPRSFVISIARSSLPRGKLDVGIRRH
jgi:hypothetical protein